MIFDKGWNTKISARETNYGSRVDYILGTRGLLPWLKHGDIQPSLKGSDHCPIYIDLHDETILPSGAKLTLREAMKVSDTRREPPRLAAKYWEEFSGKQTLLLTFFGKRANISPIPDSSSLQSLDEAGVSSLSADSLDRSQSCETCIYLLNECSF